MISLKFDDVCVDYPLHHSEVRSLSKAIISTAIGGIFSKKGQSNPHISALRHVSLSLGEGDAVGLVGHNGAGKTTMLRTAAGIFQPTSGTVTRNGTVATIIDLGAGMDSELSGSDNIIRMALLRGFSRIEIDDKLNEIIEFSELGNFIELPVKAYSSGMLMRLMFSTITMLPADILLIDEMFSTGDAEFQIKAELRIEKMIGDAKIFIFASHSHALIDRFCNKKYRLEHGNLIEV